MTNPTGKAVTILYVDDEELARKYFSRALDQDYEVLTASDVNSALTILKISHDDIDIVVTDYRMPLRNGAELLLQLETEYPRLVRILLTAHADKDALLNTVNAGDIFRILEKPLDIKDLRATLRLAAVRARARRTQLEQLKVMNETVGFLAHELNTPLAVLLNFSRGIKRRTMSEPITHAEMHEIYRAADTMESNAIYGLSVIAMFLTSVRSAQQSTIDQSSGSASQIVHSMLDTFPLGDYARQSLAVVVEEDFEVLSGIKLIPLVLGSVINNALRAVQDVSSPQLSIRITRYKIILMDNGPGIPESIKEGLMRDPVSTHLGSGGNGMGLIFCKRIMMSFGGTIDISSPPGEGTTVTLGFPKRG